MATIRELLDAGRTFSFELMPPRTPEREQLLEQALTELEPLRPSFVSITYGAGGSTRHRTHDLVTKLLGTSMVPMAHLTCAAHTRAELTDILIRYREVGLRNILALRGDPPLDSDGVLPDGELQRAADLVELTRSVGDFCVAVAAHPDKHPHAPDLATDRKHQAAKLAIADLGVTQFLFRPERYFSLVDDLASLGVHTPIIPGIMPPSNVNQLTRMAELSGAEIPREVHERLEAAGDDPNAVRQVGIDIATEVAQGLLDGGAPGLHIYTMNKSEATRAIYANLGLTPTAS